MTALSIIIPVFNKWNFTKSCLEDLSKLTEDHEIIVVDNASTDTTTFLTSYFPKVKVIKNEANLGFAKACNIGYTHSMNENVLFLNNDIKVKSNFDTWTQKLLKHCDDKSLVGPTMGQLDNNLNFKQEKNGILTGNSYMSGWCLAAHKNVWQQLILPEYKGPFSEEFGLAYFEDTDLGFRARMSKIDSVVVDIPVVHFGKQTSKQLNTYELYNSARNVFLKKWKNHKIK